MSNLNEDDLTGAQEFEAAEHEAIGNSIKLVTDLDKDPVVSTGFPLKTVPTSGNGGAQALVFGRVIALAGDYYTTHDFHLTPIAGGNGTPLPAKPYNEFKKDPKAYETQKQRFISAADSLAQDKDGYLSKMMSVFDREEAGVDAVLKEGSGENVAQAYHNHSHKIPGDMDFVKATSTFATWWLPKYAEIAWTNFDHFNVDAVTAYGVGHSIALEIAKSAGQIKDASKRKEQLRDAYFHEAFAAHYLTDLFSSGHVRAPRRKLHNSDFVMAGLDQVAGVPTNDSQCRFMHDDDSATGLLVSNAEGKEWIAYGDKQFFSPQNSLNRLYSVGALNAGVQEVITTFKTAALPEPKDYRALKLIPSPQLAYSSILNEIPAYDSIAPLWRWDDATNSYTTRADINDHSNFSARHASDPKQSLGRCEDIKTASFQGDDQFPNTTAMNPLSGGFVHLQELPRGDFTKPNGSVFSLNSWGTIDMPDLAKANARKLSFTLRNRSRAFDSTSSAEPQLPLCWKKWAIDSTTYLIRFDYAQQKSQITCSSFELIAAQPNTTSQVVKVEDLGAAPVKVTEASFRNQSLVNGVSGVPQSNLQRFFVVPVLTSSSKKNPDILAAGWAKSVTGYHATVDVVSTSIGLKSPASKIDFVDSATRQAASIKGQFKIYKGEKELTPRLIHTGMDSNTSLVTREWATVNDVSIQAFEAGNGSVVVQNPNQVLAGDILGRNFDQVLALSGAWPTFTSTIIASPSPGQPWTQISQTQDGSLEKKYTLQDPNCSLYGATLNKHYITALMPRYSENPNTNDPDLKPGLNIVQISSIQKSGKNYLNFRTILVDPAKDSVVGYRDSVANGTEILDEFHGNPNYHSLAWLRARNDIPKQDLTTRNAVMHVFSFYGVLGVRVYAPMKYNQAAGKSAGEYAKYGPYVYKLVGQAPYQGTPSLGMGMGCEGVWGYGILPWGDFGDWLDVNVWNQSSGGWAMSVEDEKRANVRGWDVGRRLK